MGSHHSAPGGLAAPPVGSHHNAPGGLTSAGQWGDGIGASPPPGMAGLGGADDAGGAPPVNLKDPFES
jgi:hypothetical protein